ncbi:3-hydroxyisobutyrate dehydrogenase [Cohaesibacter sp. ES.047]|uniref:NAD(P)-dependent oxidoreductase n=1 Tax=Cohaesibacter sp. ES.047 TaxID=1798205 RepID=UPI000BB87747|nr:NAD(P)-dependent oxidoreductase [Cohaesibacter sp. ES.047]SNY91127.1 3-hydroxyisobutyrate dehydrogenase [Cohaesibacter sp. ES.047]
MTKTIAIPLAGEMGGGVGGVLTDHGAKVLTCTEGRSQTTKDRAKSFGMKDVSWSKIAAADIILSIVPPGIALEVAGRLADALPVGASPLFLELNAISPSTTVEACTRVSKAGMRAVDGGIIGGAPKPGKSRPRLYISGELAQEALCLNDFGLDIHAIKGDIGAASALKLCYGAMNKGETGLMAAMMSAAERNGIGAELHAEMVRSRPAAQKQAEGALPRMYPKAYRWVDEMREIAEFLGKDRPEYKLWQGMADLYQALADDYAGAKEQVSSLDRFLARKES